MLKFWLCCGLIYLGTSNIAFSQCDWVRPTRDWSYQPVGGGTATIWNPLSPGVSGELQIVAIGDSVVWGNGDKPGFKIVDLVGQQLANATRRPVHLTSWAHSGAKLITDSNGTRSPIGQAGIPLGDLNAAEPSTKEQATCAAEAKPSAELVILDGCINDVGSLNIALPFPFNWTNKESIQRTAYAACGSPMTELLTSVKANFPRATIVLLNYFQIVSEDSHFPFNETITVGQSGQAKKTENQTKLAKGSTAKDVNALDRKQQQLLAKFAAKRQRDIRTEDLAIAPNVPAIPPQSPFEKWRDNSIAFLNTSQGCFTWAISSVNGVSPAPSTSSASDLPSCPPTALNAGPATSAARVYLAEVDNEPGYAYGAGSTHLWKLGEHDQMYDARKLLCEATYSDSADLEVCKLNPVAHPRPEGAQAYADSIAKLLKTAWGVAPGTLTPPLPTQ